MHGCLIFLQLLFCEYVVDACLGRSKKRVSPAIQHWSDSDIKKLEDALGQNYARAEVYICFEGAFEDHDPLTTKNDKCGEEHTLHDRIESLEDRYKQLDWDWTARDKWSVDHVFNGERVEEEKIGGNTQNELVFTPISETSFVDIKLSNLLGERMEEGKSSSKILTHSTLKKDVLLSSNVLKLKESEKEGKRPKDKGVLVPVRHSLRHPIPGPLFQSPYTAEALRNKQKTSTRDEDDKDELQIIEDGKRKQKIAQKLDYEKPSLYHAGRRCQALGKRNRACKVFAQVRKGPKKNDCENMH